MSNITSQLQNILVMCEYTKHEKCGELSRAERECIQKIRDELTELAGPEDIDAVEFIKAELNKNYGVAAIPGKYNIDSWVEAVRQENLTNLSFKFDNNKSKKDANI